MGMISALDEGEADNYNERGLLSASLDEAVDNITSAFRKRGLIDNALLVFTIDVWRVLRKLGKMLNGSPIYTAANTLPLRGAKTTLWEGGTNGAAFVYSDTLLQKSGYTSNEMIHAVDWFPTLLTIAGGKPDADLHGGNQWPTVRNGDPSARTGFVFNIDEINKIAAISGPYGAFRHCLPKHPDLVKQLQDRLSFHRATAVPAYYPPADPAANPKHFGGNWSPGWC